MEESTYGLERDVLSKREVEHSNGDKPISMSPWVIFDLSLSSYRIPQNLPSWTTVTRVLESTEPQMFTQWFDDWHGAKKKVE